MTSQEQADWLSYLIFGTGTAHSILLLALVITFGVILGRIKIGGISLGVTFVLFVGIIFGHFGITMKQDVMHFFKEFGLILFVYSIGLQVGPGFFSSLKKGGLKLNLIAIGIVLLGVITTVSIAFISGTDMPTMVGVLSGAITNTPGLGAAQQAFYDIFRVENTNIALGYAVAYPLGVLGIIFTTIILKHICKIDLKKEEEKLINEEPDTHTAVPVSLIVRNPALYGQKIGKINSLLGNLSFVISRHWCNKTNKISIARADTELNEGDKVFVITSPQDSELLKNYFGEEISMDRKQWIPTETNLISRRFVVTNKEINGKQLGSLRLRQIEGVNVTRINRAGVEMVARPELLLQMGDRLTIVGSEASMPKIKEIIGDSVKRLNEPNMVGIFLGIALGVLLGVIPFNFPGIPQPVKLGLAGGPLIIAILMGAFGYKYNIITYTTPSVNLMLREFGITIFLACVGLGAGEGFVETIVSGGYKWIGYGVIITILPLLIMGILALKVWKVNYYTLSGLIAGSTTDPPALAYANSSATNDAPAVGYATVYPLTMFLRVLSAQLLIIFFC
ncbi:putative transporter [Porphyromonas pogonae]|uniref:putative transporter n=1 Tax=Porphyromonas pogonae TaxID=867595 RepID=UPI002E78B428|nr:putative transporter [Porphyromonas pogonae]